MVDKQAARENLGFPQATQAMIAAATAGWGAPKLHVFTTSGTFQAKIGTTLILCVAGAGGAGSTWLYEGSNGGKSTCVLGSLTLTATGGLRGMPHSGVTASGGNQMTVGNNGIGSGGQLNLEGHGGYGGHGVSVTYRVTNTYKAAGSGGAGGLAVRMQSISSNATYTISVGQGGSMPENRVHEIQKASRYLSSQSFSSHSINGKNGWVAILEYGATS